MSTKNKHICVFICFNNYEHIVQCFNSVKNLPLDFFIIENFSKNSEKIKSFFIEQDLKNYVVFRENITNNAVNIVINDFKEVFKSYEYITFSDCDLFVENSEQLFDEIYKILEHDDVGVCCSSLSLENLPNVTGSQTWIPSPISVHEDYINADTGIHFMTLKNTNFNLIENCKFLDNSLSSKFRSNNLKWVSTKKNNCLHLTWDLYIGGNEYYEFKKNNLSSIFSHNRLSIYDIII